MALKTERKRFGGKTIKVKLSDTTHPDYGKRVELIDESSDDDTELTHPEKWVYGVSDDWSADLLHTTETEDIAADPDPPEWVSAAFESWGVRV